MAPAPVSDSPAPTRRQPVPASCPGPSPPSAPPSSWALHQVALLSLNPARVPASGVENLLTPSFQERGRHRREGAWETGSPQQAPERTSVHLTSQRGKRPAARLSLW